MKASRMIILGLALLLLVSGFLTGCSQPAPTPAPEETPAEETPAEEPAPAETAVNYPERPISLIVGFPPGGPTDVIARGIIPVLQEKVGMGIGIANMPGASSSVAATHVLDQKPDGYTLFYGSEIMSIWQTMGTVDLSPVEDFIPVKLTSQAIPVLAVPPDSPFETVEEFIEYARANPGKLNIGTAGPGTVPHISGLLISRELGLEFTFVPYQGGAPAIAAVMGGQVDATIEMLHSMVSNYQGGMLNILASWTNEPVEGLDIPALGMIEPSVAPSLPYGPYFGLFAPAGTPDEVIKILEEKMNESMADERWDQYCERLFLVQIDYDGEEAVEWLNDWTSKSAWLMYDLGGAPNSPADFGIPQP